MAPHLIEVYAYGYKLVTKFPGHKIKRLRKAGLIYKCECRDCEEAPGGYLWWLHSDKTQTDIDRALQR